MNKAEQKKLIERLQKLEYITSKPQEFCRGRLLEDTNYAYCLGACEAIVKLILSDLERINEHER